MNTPQTSPTTTPGHARNAKSKAEIALSILNRGGRLTISTGHELILADNGTLCTVATCNGEENGLEHDISFNEFVRQINRIDDRTLFFAAAAFALRKKNPTILPNLWSDSQNQATPTT